MRRIKSEYYKSLSGFKPNFYAVPARDYRLMRAVVKAVEVRRDLLSTSKYGIWNDPYRNILDALAALNAPGKGRR